MKVKTESDKLRQLRKGVVELYVSDHPLNCKGCPADTHCELQSVAADLGVTTSPYGFEGANHQAAPCDDSNPYFQFDPSLCIACSRCVRACDEVQGTFALTIEGRGFESRVVASQDDPFLDSECVSCGACVESCPTAALSEKPLAIMGRPEKAVTTTCAYCGVGCSFEAEVKGEAGRAHGAEPRRQGEPWARLRQGPVRLRLRHACRSHHHADDPQADHRSVAARQLGRGVQVCRVRVPPHPGPVRSRVRRRHHVLPLHQRGSVPGAEARARRTRHEQRRHLRTRLPLPHRVWLEAHPRRIRGYPGVRLSNEERRDFRHRRQPDRRPPGVRVAHEAATA